MRTRFVLITLLVLSTAPYGTAAEQKPTPENIKTAVTKSLPLLQKSADEYITKRQCFSCHHQALPLLALSTAQAHGFEVRKETLEKQVVHTHNFLTTNRDKFSTGKGTG